MRITPMKVSYYGFTGNKNHHLEVNYAPQITMGPCICVKEHAKDQDESWKNKACLGGWFCFGFLIATGNGNRPVRAKRLGQASQAPSPPSNKGTFLKRNAT